MSIITFERGNNSNLTPNFKYREFDCKCGCSITKHNTELSDKLQILRDYVGKPVIITSPYRCPTHNAKVGGARKSFHMEGCAADLIIDNVNVLEIGKICESIGFNGIGVYDDGYVHVDVRPVSEKYFWHNRDSNQVKTFGGNPGSITHKPERSDDELAKAIKQVLKDFGY